MRVEEQITYRKVSDLTLLAENPRTIKKADFQRLVDSIKINGFWKHRPLAIEEQDGKLVVLAGNQRLKAAKKLKLQEVPTILYSELTEDERADLILRDNINNGEWDGNKLQVEGMFQGVDLGFIGLEIPGFGVEDDGKPNKAAKGKKQEPEGEEPEDPDTDNEDTSAEDEEKEAFYRSMFKDCLYASNNPFDIPTLDPKMQAGNLELPLSPWGGEQPSEKGRNNVSFLRG